MSYWMVLKLFKIAEYFNLSFRFMSYWMVLKLKQEIEKHYKKLKIGKKYYKK